MALHQGRRRIGRRHRAWYLLDGKISGSAKLMIHRGHEDPMRVSLVHNPTSGGGSPSGKELKALLRAAAYEVAHYFDKKGDLKGLLRDPGKLVIVVGGDGTVGKVALALAGRGVPIAIMPAGTANNIARVLEISVQQPEEHIAGWSHAAHRKLDIGIASGPWGRSTFIEGVGFGLIASAMAQLHAQDKHSGAKRDDRGFKMLRDRLALKGLAASYDPIGLAGAVDGIGFSGHYLLLEGMNIPTVGPSINLAPDARLDDGQLDFAMIPAERRQDFVDYLADELRGGTRTPLPAEIRRGRCLRLVGNRHNAHIDDRLWRAAAKPPAVSPDVEIRAQAAAVTILTPPRHRAVDSSGRPKNGLVP